MIGATTPLLCQNKLAKPLTLPAFLPPIKKTAVEFAGVITNLIKPIRVEMIIIVNEKVKKEKVEVRKPYKNSKRERVTLTPIFLII